MVHLAAAKVILHLVTAGMYGLFIDELADVGLEEWGRRLPQEETSDLVDSHAGTRVRWKPGRGWVGGER